MAVLLVRRAVADVAVHDDEGGPPAAALGRLEGAVEHGEVVRVPDARDVPAVGDEAGGHVFAEGELGVALDRDVVVVVDPAEVVELEVPGQRRRLAGDALHEAAVAAQRVDVEVEHLEAGAVELRRRPLAGHGHAHARRHSLPEGARRGLDAGGPAIFGMAGALALELAEALDVLQGDGELAEGLVFRVHGLDAGEVQHRIEQIDAWPMDSTNRSRSPDGAGS